MTRKEWIEKNLPAYVNYNAGGGVIGCPRSLFESFRKIGPSKRSIPKLISRSTGMKSP